MLNKNQSKKWNSVKYYVVIPVLAAFILLFQTEVVAKEKNHVTKESFKGSKSIDVYKIRKSTTDQELEQIIEKVKSNQNLDVIVSDVKRNSNDELTNIKVAIQKGTKEEQKIQIDDNNAINDCEIIITTEENGFKKINLLTILFQGILVGNQVYCFPVVMKRILNRTCFNTKIASGAILSIYLQRVFSFRISPRIDGRGFKTDGCILQ